MDLRNLDNLKQFLASHQLKLRKSLSQNFLVERELLERIVQESNVRQGDRVFEIGPGLGALTLSLLEAGASVVAIEKDTAFAGWLPKLLKEYKDRLQVIEGDALQYSFTEKMKVVSNIPYQITVPILNFLATQRTLISQITLLLQKEVGEKMMATPGSKKNIPLALFSQFYFDLIPLFEVSKKHFFPVPKVDSIVLVLDPKETLPLPSHQIESFFSFIDKCFTHKRKMLRSTLKRTDYFEKIGVNVTARPEDLSLEDYLLLFGLFSTQSEGNST